MKLRNLAFLLLLVAAPLTVNAMSVVTGIDDAAGVEFSSVIPAVEATLVAQSAISSATSAASLAITTPTGITAGDCLMLGIEVDAKPTSAVSCPSGFTQIATAGELTDGADQPQALLCARVVTGSESSTYSPAWTGSAVAQGMMADIEGLSECTTPDTAYANANSSTVGMLAAAPASASFGAGELNVAVIAANAVAFTSAAAIASSSAHGAFIFALNTGTAGTSIGSSSNTYFAVAGALLH